MYSGRTVGVVVPAYNEEGYVGDVVDTMPSFVDRVYLIDDGSTDDTWAEINEHVAAAPDDSEAFERRWVPIRHGENMGVGAAIVTGYRHAREDGVDVTAVMAGDAQMDPDVLARMIAPVVDGDVEYAKGSRFLRPGDWRGMPPVRLFGNAVLTFLTRVSSGYWGLTDSQNGYTAISHRALCELDLSALYDGYGFANDLLVSLNVAGLRVADVEHSAEFVYDDENWKSHIDLAEFVPTTSLLLARGFLRRLRAEYASEGFGPFPLYVAGAGAGLAAVLGGLAAVLAGRIDGTADLAAPAAVLAAGVAALLVAMARDRADNEALFERVYADGTPGPTARVDTDPASPTAGPE